MRLTSEREKELREESQKSYPYEPTLQWGLQEAFEEIDALRKELAFIKEETPWSDFSHCQAVLELNLPNIVKANCRGIAIAPDGTLYNLGITINSDEKKEL